MASPAVAPADLILLGDDPNIQRRNETFGAWMGLWPWEDDTGVVLLGLLMLEPSKMCSREVACVTGVGLRVSWAVADEAELELPRVSHRHSPRSVKLDSSFLRRGGCGTGGLST